MGEFETVVYVELLISLGFSCFNKFVKLEFKEDSTEFAVLVSEFLAPLVPAQEELCFEQWVSACASLRPACG